MKKSTSTVIISFGIIQCLAVIGCMTFMQCKKTEPKPIKDIGKALNANDSIYLQKTALTPETKAALDLLAKQPMAEGSLGEQLVTFIGAGIYDFGEMFKFMVLKFHERDAVVIEKTRHEIDDLGRIMLAFPQMKIRLEAYTDNTGSAKKNEQVTIDRVNYIKSQLMSFGVTEDRVEAKGFGPKYPVGDNKTPVGQMINNRIELVLVKLF